MKTTKFQRKHKHKGLWSWIRCLVYAIKTQVIQRKKVDKLGWNFLSSLILISSNLKWFGSSLAVQWLALSASTARARVQSLVREPKYWKMCGMVKKKKNFYASKDILKRVEKQYTEWKKISANHRSENEFASRICFENVYTDTKARPTARQLQIWMAFLKLSFWFTEMIDNCILPIISTVNTRWNETTWVNLSETLKLKKNTQKTPICNYNLKQCLL